MASVPFVSKEDALRMRSRIRRRPPALRFCEAQFRLYSKVPPRILETVPVAERIRHKLMGIHRKISGGDPSAVSPLFSGKNSDGAPLQGHEHLYILLLDEDRDGRLDRLVLKSKILSFERSELDAMDAMRSIWQPDGKPDVNLILTRLSDSSDSPRYIRWISATPFVTKRHHRKGRGEYSSWIADEVRRECDFHHLPQPSEINPVDRTQSIGRPYRWMEFIRSRKGERPLRGHGFLLAFDEPIAAPFAIGALAHYGLGLFVPACEE